MLEKKDCAEDVTVIEDLDERGLKIYNEKYKKYKEVNDIWLSGKKCTFEEFCERRQKLSGKLLGELYFSK